MEKENIGLDEFLEWQKLNSNIMSEQKAKEIFEEIKFAENVDVLDNYIDLDEYYKNNPEGAIGEYKGLKDKINKVIESLNKSKENENITLDDRDEKDNLDEKEGKEELDKDTKEKVKERDKDSKNGKEQEETENKEKEEKDIVVDEKEENEAKNEEDLDKNEYLARVRKLHEMRLVEYKDEFKKDDVKTDKHFKNMIYLQKSVNRDRQFYIKKYGQDGIKELAKLENEYVKEELKYEKTIVSRHEKEITRLNQLEEKLDSIMDKMDSLQNNLSEKHISVEDYNDEIKGLEQEKLDTLWEINKLNPELIQQKQDRNIKRDELEKYVTSRNAGKYAQNNMSKENNSKQQELRKKEEKQQGVPEKTLDDMNDRMEENIDEKEKRMDELKNHLKNIDITTKEGKEEALQIISEIQTLESQQMSMKNQKEDLNKNMKSNVKDYGILKDEETKREDITSDMEKTVENIDVNEVSDEMMEQLRSQAIEDPSTPEQSEKYLENMQEIAEDAEKEQDNKEVEEDNQPTLFNRNNRRPY